MRISGVTVAPTVNWHPSFFRLLSSYKSVTSLYIVGGHFRDLRRIVEALPALKDVHFMQLRFLGASPGGQPSLIQEPGRPRRRPSLRYLRLCYAVPDLLLYLHLFSGAEQIITDAECGTATFPRGNMAVALFPVSRLELWGIDIYHTVPSSGLLVNTADATSLVRNIPLEEIAYTFFIHKDYADFRSTIQAIATMLSQGVGEKVTKIRIELALYFDGLDNFLPYEPDDGPAPPLTSPLYVSDCKM
ncbi:uncharacterized protein B0H18DRAFT_351881 [Fomitopsis serialis]|uniref:uncharacterized protein n=1 Tax=Fomitopsis serialis TaxID=139415 RepID=UPI0020089F59|nr:uncharacterized protein B0H18DRAFT_351881 [Neoantrodia serialis]KAH9926140.1 hypothetical protein B0H18DRAFT_351881 [Neoantrodia serialis]